MKFLAATIQMEAVEQFFFTVVLFDFQYFAA